MLKYTSHFENKMTQNKTSLSYPIPSKETESQPHVSPLFGQLVSLGLGGVKPELLNDSNGIEKMVIKALRDSNFGIVGKVFYEFDPQGLTGMVVLSESHFAFHTYPEHNVIEVELYSCRGPYDAEPAMIQVRNHFNPTHYTYKRNDIVPLVKVNPLKMFLMNLEHYFKSKI